MTVLFWLTFAVILDSIMYNLANASSYSAYDAVLSVTLLALGCAVVFGVPPLGWVCALVIGIEAILKLFVSFVGKPEYLVGGLVNGAYVFASLNLL